MTPSDTHRQTTGEDGDISSLIVCHNVSCLLVIHEHTITYTPIHNNNRCHGIFKCNRQKSPVFRVSVRRWWLRMNLKNSSYVYSSFTRTNNSHHSCKPKQFLSISSEWINAVWLLVQSVPRSTLHPYNCNVLSHAEPESYFLLLFLNICSRRDCN